MYEMTEPGTPESQAETTPNPETSGQLVLYLLGEDTLKGGPSEFPNYLNLEIFEKYMRQLDEQRSTVNQEISPGSLGIKPINIEGEGEITRIIYYDVNANSVNATDTVRGGLSSVRSLFPDTYEEDKVPLVEMHTHPQAQLPSNVDYQFMLLGVPEAKIRGIRAITVLCPELQLFALATDKTPILDPEGLHQLLTQWYEPNRQHEVEGGKYLKTLENRWNRVFTFITRAYQQRQEKIVERFKRDMDRIDQDLEPEGWEAENEDSYPKTLERINRLGPKVLGKYAKHLNKVFSRIQLEFVRNMGIKLYISTDFKNFTALPEDFSP